MLGPPRDSRPPTFTGDLASFAGVYTGVGRGRPTTITIAAGADSLTMTGAPPSATPETLTYRGGDTFGVKDTLVTFEREGGRVVRLKLDAVFGFYRLVKKPAATN